MAMSDEWMDMDTTCGNHWGYTEMGLPPQRRPRRR
jgi:hypothetical protein